jgi:hypothetical protein
VGAGITLGRFQRLVLHRAFRRALVVCPGACYRLQDASYCEFGDVPNLRHLRRLQSVYLSSTFKLSCRPPRGFAFEAAGLNLHDHQGGCILFERPARLGTMSEAETRVARHA